MKLLAKPQPGDPVVHQISKYFVVKNVVKDLGVIVFLKGVVVPSAPRFETVGNGTCDNTAPDPNDCNGKPLGDAKTCGEP